MKRRAYWFQRHPRLAALSFGIGLLLLLDVVVGTVLFHLGIVVFPAVDYYRTPHPIWHHGFYPNIEYEYASAGPLYYPIATNSIGFRDREVREVEAKQTTRRRVLVLGDSFTEGFGVAWESSFVGMLQKELEPDGFEFLNLGCISHSPLFHICKTHYLFENLGFEVDEAIILLDLNDIEDATRHEFDPDRPFTVASDRSLLDYKLKRFVATRTVMINGLRVLFRRLRELARPYVPGSRTGYRECLWPDEERYWEEYGRIGLPRVTEHMDQLVGMLEERGVPYTVVIYPWPDQIVLKDRDCKHRLHWREWSERHEGAFLDLWDDFLDAGPAQEVLDTYFLEDDVHWNRKGHRLVADRLLEHLRSRDRPPRGS